MGWVVLRGRLCPPNRTCLEGVHSSFVLYWHRLGHLGMMEPPELLCELSKCSGTRPRLSLCPRLYKSCLSGGCEASHGVIPPLEKDLEGDIAPQLISAPLCPLALLCACTSCLQTNYTCETDGACMVSIFNLDGMEHHVRTCIPKVELVPAGKPFYCLSSEDLRNTHCCYIDFCNKIDLRVPSGE